MKSHPDKPMHTDATGNVPPPPEALLLDLGNVVLDVDFRRAFRTWAAAAGVDEAHFHRHWRAESHYELHETGDLTFREYAVFLGNHLGVKLPLATWRRGWNDVFVDLFPGVMSLLAELTGHLPVCAFTNTNPTHEAYWRKHYPALDVFQHIYVSSRIGRRKPTVEAYHYVAERMGVEPADIWFLDDNRHNVEGAVLAGLRTFHIRTEQDVESVLRSVLDCLR